MRTLLCLLCLGIGAAFAAPSGAVTLLQIDTFEDGTTQGWRVALGGLGVHPAPPTNVATDGPRGADDAYLSLTAVGGIGAGSRLSVLNPAQWQGDFLDAGITQIAMDVRNLGLSDVFLRLSFEDPVAGPPSNIAFSTDAVFVPATQDWAAIVFPIAPEFLTAGLGTVAGALSNTTVLRLYHSQEDTFPGALSPISTIVAEVGVDNICATTPGVSCARAVPEPPAVALVVIGLGVMLARRLMASAPVGARTR